MAVRVRSNGSIVCAAMYGEEPGDQYLDDSLHYWLSVECGVLVSEPHERHQADGLWWWFDNVPKSRFPDPYYRSRRIVEGVTVRGDY